MKRGVVIHHGSIPLVVRFLIEKFTNAGFAKICFATSTLAQGVNMPFDIVLVENARFEGTQEDKTLGLKNLIGRAGRRVIIPLIAAFKSRAYAASQNRFNVKVKMTTESIDSVVSSPYAIKGTPS